MVKWERRGNVFEVFGIYIENLVYFWYLILVIGINGFRDDWLWLIMYKSRFREKNLFFTGVEVVEGY